MSFSPQLRHGIEAPRCGRVRLDQFCVDADVIESTLIQRAKITLAGDDNRRVYLRSGDFVPDEDAREVIRETCGIELIHQHARAHAEDMVEQAVSMTRAIEARIEGGKVHAARRHEPAENAVVAKQREDLPGHVRHKTTDRAVADAGMLAVRAGKQNRCRGSRGDGESAEDLHLLTAHHVGNAVGVAADQSRANEHFPRCIRGSRAHGVSQIAQGGRAGNIGDLDPSLGSRSFRS